MQESLAEAHLAVALPGLTVSEPGTPTDLKLVNFRLLALTFKIVLILFGLLLGKLVLNLVGFCATWPRFDRIHTLLVAFG